MNKFYKISYYILLSLLLFSCARRDDKYQEFIDEKTQPSDTKDETTTKVTKKDSNSEKQIPKYKESGIVISPLEASEYVGKYATVKGFVAEVNKRERVAYLNFVETFPKNPFTAVIFASRFDDFGNIGNYAYKNVEVTGIISLYKGNPQIVLDSPSQIKIIK